MEGLRNSEVVIIGGGLSDLTPAALLARAGKPVSLFEQSSSEIGGRARTSVFEGFTLIKALMRCIFLTLELRFYKNWE
ncbi:MAG: NAD(P)-binding protein [Thermoproteota archaeon]|nr:NAD(P)-binding protein [Thermoproteota archaeon]